MSRRQSFVGVDGCRAGWFAVRVTPGVGVDWMLLPELGRILALRPKPRFVAIDIPIGLPPTLRPGGRECDRAARALLGARRSSVFSPPTRRLLGARSYDEVRRHGVSIQTFGIFPKIREVDTWMTSASQQRVREAHPELAFRGLAGAPMVHPKRSAAGLASRLATLCERASHVIPNAVAIYEAASAGFARCDVARDDILDAMVLATVAVAMADGRARRANARTARDRRGLRMDTWY